MPVFDIYGILLMALAVYAAYLIYRRYVEMSKSGEWSEEERLWAREGSFFVIGLFVIIFVSFPFLFIEGAPLSLSDAMRSSTSSFAALRMILPLFYLVWCVPGAVLGEVFYSRIKKRSVRPRNVLIFALMIGEWLLASALLLTLFDILFRDMSFLVQFPLMAVSFSMSMFIMAATSRIRRISDFMKRAFD